MDGTIDALNRWGAAWTTLMVDALWQSTLVALLVALAAAALARSAPAVRYWLWQIVAIKLLLAPLWGPLWGWTLELPWLPATIAPHAQAGEPPSSSTIQSSTIASSGAPATTVALDVRKAPALPPPGLGWRGWLLAAWAAVVLGQELRLVVQRARLARFLARAAPAGAKTVGLVRQVAEALGLARPPRVLMADYEGSPFVCGLARPTVVLPRGLAATLDVAELRGVIAHELAHVQRRDLLWGWTGELARMLYFFHPVAHWTVYRLRLERELACDQAAMRVSGRGPAEYAETLVRVLSSASGGGVFCTQAASFDGGAPGGAGLARETQAAALRGAERIP